MGNSVEHFAGIAKVTGFAIGGDEVVGEEGVLELEGFDDKAMEFLEMVLVLGFRAELEELGIVV